MGEREWKEVRLGDIAQYSNDKINTEKLTLDNYISTENMLPNKAGKTTATSLPSGKVLKFKYGQTLVSNIRPYFKKIWYASINGGYSPDVLAFELLEDIDSKFFYYQLSQDIFFDYVISGSKGTKMPRGDKKQIMMYTIKLPPFPEQIAIAATLSCLDDKIELNNHINKTLEEIAQAIFKSWFVDFEPFQDGEFEDSELGRIPKGWRVGTISDLGEVIGGSTPPKACPEYYTNNGIAWITPKDLSKNKDKFISKGEIDITELGLKNSSTQLMPKGTVLFSSRAPIGYIAIAKNDITTNQGFKSVVPKNNIGTAYIYYFLKNSLEVIENRATGSTFKEVSGSIMKQIPALTPKDNVLLEFKNTCGKYFEYQAFLEEQNRNLANIRDTLLPKLMSGEIRVAIEAVTTNKQG